MKILDYFKSKHTYSYINSDNIQVGPAKKTKVQFLAWVKKELKALESKMGDEDKSSYYEVRAKMSAKYGDPETAIFEVLKKEAYEVFQKGIKLNTGVFPGDSVEYTGCIKVIDVFSNERIVFDTIYGGATGYDIDGFEEWLREQENKVTHAIRQQTIRGIIEYDPYNMESVQATQFRDKTINKVNSHQFPDWRRKEIKDPKLPQSFLDFMSHLFPNKECREYIYFWLKNTIEKRNYIHLLLHSPKETGKNTFMELVKMLVGSSNYKTIDPTFWESRFNFELRNRRVCYFDEHDITPENINQFKAYGNEMISIEGKGQNISGDAVNYASYVISNNNPGGNFLSSDERKFSVPKVTREKIVKAFDLDFIHNLWASIKNDPDYIANIGWWVINNGANNKFDNQRPYKTEVFWELVDNSLAEWQRSLIDKIEEGRIEKTMISTLKTELDIHYHIGAPKVAKFVDNHTDREGDRYARVVKDEKGIRWLQVEDKYLRKKEDKFKVEESDMSDVEESLQGWDDAEF